MAIIIIIVLIYHSWKINKLNNRIDKIRKQIHHLKLMHGISNTSLLQANIGKSCKLLKYDGKRIDFLEILDISNEILTYKEIERNNISINHEELEDIEMVDFTEK